MNKLLLVVAVISAFSFVSCTKDRTCTCTRTVTSDGITVTSTSIITYNKSMKKDARANCMSYTVTDDGTTTTEDCKLK